MTKEELITKQQLEIEGLKASLSRCIEVASDVKNRLIYVQQWSTKCPDFPRVSMNAAVMGARDLDAIIDEVMASE